VFCPWSNYQAPLAGTGLITYQPASRFWTFQPIEGSWLLLLSSALVAVTVWLIRHRAAEPSGPATDGHSEEHRPGDVWVGY